MFKQIYDKLEDIYYICWRAQDKIRGVPDEIKYFIQRGRRGYSDRDCWAIYGFLVDILPPMLRKVAKEGCGCPSDFFDSNNKGNECARWREELEKMAVGFEAARHLCDRDDFRDGKFDEEKQKVWKGQFDIGMESFKENFFALWD